MEMTHSKGGREKPIRAAILTAVVALIVAEEASQIGAS